MLFAFSQRTTAHECFLFFQDTFYSFAHMFTFMHSLQRIDNRGKQIYFLMSSIGPDLFQPLRCPSFLVTTSCGEEAIFRWHGYLDD